MYPVERNLEKYCLKRALHVMPDIAAIAIDESITPSRKTITNDGVETLVCTKYMNNYNFLNSIS